MTKSRRKILPKPDDHDHSRAFIEKAREIGADEQRSVADGLLEKLAKMKPMPRSTQSPIFRGDFCVYGMIDQMIWSSVKKPV